MNDPAHARDSRRRFLASLVRGAGALGVGALAPATLTSAVLGLGATSSACTPHAPSETPMNRAGSPASPGSAATTRRLPAGFVGHGAPLLALDAQKGAPLRAWGAALGTPRAVLVVSAHWEAAPASLGATGTRPLVYDFGGFPRPLYEVQYPAPGAPWLADRVDALLGAPARRTDRGLDHGVWTPLVHLFPDADVPVLQLSLPSREGPRALFALGRRLAPLRAEGVFVLGSGNVTHDLRAVDFSETTPPPGWARDFDAWVRETLARRDWDTLVDFAAKAPAYRRAHPTDEHWLPILVAAGAGADATGEAVRFPIEGWEFGSLSRRAVALG
jgi:4,5-DOPA dioxygenase extradiol